MGALLFTHLARSSGSALLTPRFCRRDVDVVCLRGAGVTGEGFLEWAVQVAPPGLFTLATPQPSTGHGHGAAAAGGGGVDGWSGPAPPPVYVQYTDPMTARPLYWNWATQTSHWELPPPAPAPAPAPPPTLQSAACAACVGHGTRDQACTMQERCCTNGDHGHLRGVCVPAWPGRRSGVVKLALNRCVWMTTAGLVAVLSAFGASHKRGAFPSPRRNDTARTASRTSSHSRTGRDSCGARNVQATGGGDDARQPQVLVQPSTRPSIAHGGAPATATRVLAVTAGFTAPLRAQQQQSVACSGADPLFRCDNSGVSGQGAGCGLNGGDTRGGCVTATAEEGTPGAVSARALAMLTNTNPAMQSVAAAMVDDAARRSGVAAKGEPGTASTTVLVHAGGVDTTALLPLPHQDARAAQLARTKVQRGGCWVRALCGLCVLYG